MELYLDQHSLPTYKALASETRLAILQLLAERGLTVTELAKELNLSKAIISRHVRLLEDCRLIRLNDSWFNDDEQHKRLFSLALDRVEIVFPQKVFLPFKKASVETRLGLFSDFLVVPTCGLADTETIIGLLDEPQSFVDEHRSEAALLWFSRGYVEYIIPNKAPVGSTLQLLELSFEISSEFPESNNNWPSDISFYINGIKLGTWTCPGNFSDVRGKLTPDWWKNHFSQYGLLKHLRITNSDTGIDGVKISEVRLADLGIEDQSFYRFKIAVDEGAVNQGGVTLFGDTFGNHEQNIRTTIYYSEE
ncbi:MULTISPECIES: ArsR/SmtB family transcription factor [Enterococcus]|uniref:ArsR/SmtB family transcription factor n=1 Tax=Enterococcus TaxID=1350 RepID=UPI00094D246F|nr:ArsR family transcriptional regulator [Enterococcus thailandicus]MDA3965229.1 ArsR family transcriptional regulator [Enterococcus thailandicus]